MIVGGVGGWVNEGASPFEQWLDADKMKACPFITNLSVRASNALPSSHSV